MDDAELFFRLFHPAIVSLTLFKSRMKKNYYSKYDDDDDDDDDPLDNEVEISAREDQAKSKALAF